MLDRHFLQTIALTACWTSAAFSADARMNVLLLSVDDMNCDSVGAFGCQVADTTPRLDALAAESMRFRHAHVHASSCVPSRNIIMTGRYLYNSGVEGFYAVPSSIRKNLTIAEFLRQHGYFTVIQGKESHSMPFHPHTEWDIDFSDGRMKGHNSRHPDTFAHFTKVGIEAAQKAGKPFFYNINIHDPHLPLYNWSSKKGVGLHGQDRNNPPGRVYAPEEIVVPAFLPDTPKVRQELAAYYSSVRRADDCVGSVIDTLKEMDVYSSTLILFFSDHGMPFPFAKTAMYYHSTHTPLIVRWPRVTTAGSIDDDHVLGTVDIFPTIAESLALPIPTELDGRSFADILRGHAQSDRDYVYTMYEENVGGNRQPARSVISKDYGYICNLWSDGERRFATATRGMASMREIERLAKAGNSSMQRRLDLFQHRIPEEFFNYGNDPDALHNLMSDPQQADRIETFRKQMIRFMEASGDPSLPIFLSRNDKQILSDYLGQLDEESKARKADPTTYKRNYDPAKANKQQKQKKKKSQKQAAEVTAEEAARIEKRRQNRASRKAAQSRPSE